MSGLGGLNKSPHGVVLGVVQLQLPIVKTPKDLAAQTAQDLRHGGQGAAQHGDDGSRGVPGVLAARAVHGHQSRDHVPAGRARSGCVQARLRGEQDLGLLLDHGVQPRRQSVQQRHHHRRQRRAEALLPQAASVGAGGALGAGQPRHSRSATGRTDRRSRSSSATTACSRRWRAKQRTRARRS